MADLRVGTRVDGLRDAGWVLLRICAGALIFARGYRHALGSREDGLHRIVDLIENLRHAGLPAPEALAWLVSLLGLSGGALILVGLVVRPIAAIWALGTAIAVLSLRASGFVPMESALWQLAAALAFLIGGAGPRSVDAFLQDRRRRRSSSLFRRNVGVLR